MPEVSPESRGALEVVTTLGEGNATTVQLNHENRKWLRYVADHCDNRVEQLDVSVNDVLTGIRLILNELDPDDNHRFHMDDENLQAFLLTILDATRQYQWETHAAGVPGDGPTAGDE